MDDPGCELDVPRRQARKPIGDFLFEHLRELGVETCFGIPGDYILPLYKALERTEGIDHLVATHEPCAAFTADAYGRQRGLGVLLVTYGVGGFNALNGVAGAYAENSPLLVISGGPPRGYSNAESPVAVQKHHMVRHASDQLEIFRRITDLSVRIDGPEYAAQIIRMASAHARQARLPVYLEIPTDLMNASIPVPEEEGGRAPDIPDPEAMAHAVKLFADRITAAHAPLLLIGVEAARYFLQDNVLRIVEARGIPAATTVLAKGFLEEERPGMLGVYAGALTPAPDVRGLVEGADLVVMLGAKITDVNCGAFTADLSRERLLIAKSSWVGDGFTRFSDHVPFAAFVRELSRTLPGLSKRPAFPSVSRFPLADSASTMDQYIGVLDKRLGPQHVVVADTGDSCYSSLFAMTHRRRGYLAPTFYNTMGFAVPAALGAKLADPGCRPVVLVGDGAFQMTGIEFSNMVRLGHDTIVVVFNNDGYGMQRVFVDGGFNDLQRWDYAKVTELVGGGRFWRVSSPREFEQALGAAGELRGEPALIEVNVERGVISTGLKLLTQAFAREKTGICPLAPDDAGSCEHTQKCAFCRAAIWE